MSPGGETEGMSDMSPTIKMDSGYFENMEGIDSQVLEGEGELVDKNLLEEIKDIQEPLE